MYLKIIMDMHEMSMHARLQVQLANQTYLLSTQLSKNIVSFPVHSDKTSAIKYYKYKYYKYYSFYWQSEILRPLQCGFLSGHNISNPTQST